MLHTALVQPDMFGVRHENHGKLDEDMEAFCQSIPLSFEQLTRMVWNRPDRRELLRKAEQFASPVNLGTQQAQRQIVTGGLYPLQPSGSGQPSQARGVVDWMSAPKPMVDPQVHARMVEMFELWVWDDAREDWTTLQLIGDDLLILGQNQLINAFAWDTDAKETNPELKGHHPFNEFCVNPIDGYYWGRSEVLNVAMLQEMLSARIDGINRKIKKIEDPSYKASGVAGSNQNALTRFKKPGGYWADTNPNAKLEQDEHDLPNVLIGWVHEIERMFDEMGGLPPTARGHGDAGVRSHAHAETLVRMFSPRFKDRALLAERSVEGIGGLHLDMHKAHDPKKLLAWVPKDIAGPQGLPPNELIPPPAKNSGRGAIRLDRPRRGRRGDDRLPLVQPGVRGRGQGADLRFAESRRHVAGRSRGALGRVRPRGTDGGNPAAQHRARRGRAAGGGAETRYAREEIGAIRDG